MKCDQPQALLPQASSVCKVSCARAAAFLHHHKRCANGTVPGIIAAAPASSCTMQDRSSCACMRVLHLGKRTVIYSSRQKCHQNARSSARRRRRRRRPGHHARSCASSSSDLALVCSTTTFRISGGRWKALDVSTHQPARLLPAPLRNPQPTISSCCPWANHRCKRGWRMAVKATPLRSTSIALSSVPCTALPRQSTVLQTGQNSCGMLEDAI